MKLSDQAGLNEGADRYGSRENGEPGSKVDWKCPKCGNEHTISSVYDESICMKGGCGTKMERQNADSSTLGYDAKTTSTTARSKRKIGQKFYEVGKNGSVETCKCDHPKSQHVEDGTGFCKYCTCKEYRPGTPRENASIDNMACPACDKDEAGIAALMSHLQEDHDMTEAHAEKVIGARDNVGGKCAICGHSHDGDVCDDCACAIFSPTEAKPVKGRYDNADDETRFEVHCDDCKKTIKTGATLKESVEGGVCADCKKARMSNGLENTSVYTPPLRSVAERAAEGQKRYGEYVSDGQ